LKKTNKDKKKGKGSLAGEVGKRIKNALQRMFILKSSLPKEYRPYLGPESVTEDPEEKRIQEKLRKSHQKKRSESKKPGIFKQLSRDLEIKGEIRRKRKHKKQLKRKYEKEQRREKRIAFIRRYYPQYKRTAEDWIDLSLEDNQEEKEKFRHGSYFTYTVNSVASFILAYLIVYLLYQFSVLIVASNWKLDSILFYYDLAFNDFSPLWNRKNIIVVTFAGPFVSLLIGFLFLRYLSIRPKINKQLKLFTLWVGLHGFNFFLGAFA
jgi:hypothetical protein